MKAIGEIGEIGQLLSMTLAISAILIGGCAEPTASGENEGANGALVTSARTDTSLEHERRWTVKPKTMPEKPASAPGRLAAQEPPNSPNAPETEQTGTHPNGVVLAQAYSPLPDADSEELFAGWPKPKAVLLVTGRQHGYLEPCGCSGLDNQKGGLIRRATLVKQLREKGWNVVPIDAGNQVRRFGRQPEIKFQITTEGLKMMDYQAIAFGSDDLRLPAPELAATIAPQGDQSSTFVGANVVVLDPAFTSTYRVIEAGDVKIGVTAVLGARNQRRIDNEDITLRGAEEALAEVWPKLKQKKCDLYVLIVHGSLDESLSLGKRFPGFQIVVSTGGAGEPKRVPEKIAATGAQLIEVGTKGMYAGIVGVFSDEQTPLRYQRVPLDARFVDSPDMLRLLGAYQDQLKEAGLEGLGIRPQPYPSGRKFVGSKACEDCHPKAYEIWKDGRDKKGGPHAHAFQTLMKPPKRANVPRHYDPECISCHVVGWNPRKYFPYMSGYLSLEKTPELINVGCENCHGPGSAHVDAENGDVELSEEAMEKLRQEVTLPLEQAEQKCLGCHDLDNSPDFQEKGAFQRYWEKIKH